MDMEIARKRRNALNFDRKKVYRRLLEVFNEQAKAKTINYIDGHVFHKPNREIFTKGGYPSVTC
jgi:hypothetical protein